MTPTTFEVERARQVTIHQLLNIPNTGRKKMIRCPFHNDRTPSMCIFPDGGFKCFGCNAHGRDAIDFVKHMGYDFKGAVKQLNNL